MTSTRPNDLEDLRLRIRSFADARDWEQFHTPKNLVMALAVEAAELMEPLQWLSSEEATEAALENEVRERITDEIADVAIYLIRLADVMGVDIAEAVDLKLAKNEERFPPEQMKGKARP